MEAPYTFVSLPDPLDKECGRITASPVYGLRGARKRKRHEVAVGIDGEGVNLYNVFRPIPMRDAMTVLNKVAGPNTIAHHLIRSPAAVIPLLSTVLHLLSATKTSTCTTTDICSP